jgi:hypothetical protein
VNWRGDHDVKGQVFAFDINIALAFGVILIVALKPLPV